MNLEDIPSIPDVEIRTVCTFCPVIVAAQSTIEGLQETQEKIGGAAQSQEVEDAIRDRVYTMENGHISKLDDPDELIRAIRMSSAKAIEDMAETKEKLEGVIGVVQEGCPGSFRMRAMDKLGRVVTVTLCSSPQAPCGVEIQNEAVTVRRTET